MPSCWKARSTSDHVEVTLRVTIASFVSYCLAVAYLPNAIPSSMSYIVGVFGPAMAMNLPTLLFALGAVVPILVFVLICGLAFATLLLAAASIQSDSVDGVALMVVLFSLCSLWLSGLRFGRGTGSYAGLCIIFAALLSLSLYQLVSDGVIITIAPDHQEGGEVVELYADIVEAAMGAATGDGCVSETIGGDGLFSGQPATVCLDRGANDGAGQLTVSVPGGTYLVRGLWTESGIDSELGIMRAFLIVACWGILCAAVGPLLPPFRTARSLISRVVLPAELGGAAAYLSNVKGGNEEADGPKDGENDDDGELVDKLVSTMSKLFMGKPAALTAYEPRLWRPLECTWVKLQDLMQRANMAVLASLAMHTLPPPPAQFSSSARQHLADRTKQATKVCAGVLLECADAIKAREGTVSVPSDVTDNSGEGTSDEDMMEVRGLRRSTVDVVKATNEWITAMDGSTPPKGSTEVFSNLKSNLIPWIAPFVGFLRRLFVDEIRNLFSAESWKRIVLPPRPDLEKAVWCLKLAVGSIVLYVVTVYAEGYRRFEVPTRIGQVELNPVTVANPPPQSFSGWHISSYIAATTQTMEGTVKKGVLRLLGTCVGGFSAWLALVTCGEGPTNPYGLVAWLTVTTLVVVFFSLESGPTARMGLSKDYGQGGFYFVLTQALIALEVYAGAGSKENLVVNRILANVAGVLMSIVLSIIPPTIRGGDPRHALGIVDEAIREMGEMIRRILTSDSDGIQKLQQEFYEVALPLRNDSLDLVGDALRLHRFPICRVDDRLRPEIDTITVTCSAQYQIMTAAKYALDSTELCAFIQSSTAFRNDLIAIQGVLERSDSQDGILEGKAIEENSANSDFEVQGPRYAHLLMHWIRTLSFQLKRHEENLRQIKSGCWGGRRKTTAV